MRTFVAVFPPQRVREALFRAARDLPASKAFRLIGPEKLHLTLKFLGNVAEDDMSRVKQASSSYAAGTNRSRSKPRASGLSLPRGRPESSGPASEKGQGRYAPWPRA